jgi:outer membrane receptor protein involved in Fe transport
LAGPGRRAGYEHIGPLYNANLHLAYNLPSEWLTGAGTRVFMNVNNIFDTPPPYGDTTSGAPAGTTGTPPIGNAIGRLLEVGVTKSF